MNDTSLIHPEIYLKQAGIHAIKFHGLCHVFFNKKYMDYFDGYELMQIINTQSICVYSIKVKDSIFIASIRNSSSLSAIDFECLISLGFTEFIFYGFTCAMNCCNIGDIVLIERAYIGEGVSQYYRNKKTCGFTSNQLNNWIVKHVVDIKLCNCYTTDAFFMETKKLIEKLVNLGIECIDMECSALTSISQYRKVKSSFVFCVSDTLNKGKWEYNRNLDLREKLVNALLLLYN